MTLNLYTEVTLLFWCSVISFIMGYVYAFMSSD